MQRLSGIWGRHLKYFYASRVIAFTIRESRRFEVRQAPARARKIRRWRKPVVHCELAGEVRSLFESERAGSNFDRTDLLQDAGGNCQALLIQPGLRALAKEFSDPAFQLAAGEPS